MTYRAAEITGAGVLTLVVCEDTAPAPDEVLNAVEACGICGADRSDISTTDPAVHRVPGHEVVGKIIALGVGVPEIWKLGQRVGVGRFGGHCETCPQCRAGKFHLCRGFVAQIG